MRLLIVEDEKSFKEAAQKFFESLSGETELVWASNYEEAIKELEVVNALITDVFFPEKGSGYVVTELTDVILAKLKRAVAEEIKRSLEKEYDIDNVMHGIARTASSFETLKEAVKPFGLFTQKEPTSYCPLGILVAEKAEESKIPFVLATSTHHHDELTEPVCIYSRSKGWPEMVDATKPEEKASTEFWAKVWKRLKKQIET